MKKAKQEPRAKKTMTRVDFVVDAETKRRMRLLAADKMVTVKQILVEAFEEYWAKHQKGKTR